MELRILRYFLTVAREEDITRAAETLPMPGKERERLSRQNVLWRKSNILPART